MTGRTVAAAELCVGAVLLRRPRRALRLLGYPHDTLAARTVLRVLGLRQLVQGSAELTGRRRVLLAGAAVDVAHAGTALVYAQRSQDGRRAGRRNAAVALTLAAAQLLAAARTRPREVGTGRHEDRQPAAPLLARVAGPDAAAWPHPTDPGQQVLVDQHVESLVRLRGGAMDGATVILEAGQTGYSITDTEHGRLHYLPTGEQDPDGRPVLGLEP